MYGNEVDFSVLQGLVLQEIRCSENPDGNDVLYFVTSDGCFEMYHSQDCCESVYLEDVIGDPRDLKNVFVTLAEEAMNDPEPEHLGDYEPESYTWTFYKLSTPKGDLTIRWYGESNGYYSESVNFCRMTGPVPAKSKEWMPNQ